MQTNYQLSKYVRCLKFPDKSKHQFTNKTKLNQHGILKKTNKQIKKQSWLKNIRDAVRDFL